jgi:hypothetical protein
MATFLQLCQSVARDSGTVSGTQPTTVTGQTGRLGKIVQFTVQAWTSIQNARGSWLWMRDEFPATALTVAGTARYTGASWNITDLGEWITEKHGATIYAQAIGVADECEIAFVDWLTWRRFYDRGAQTNNRPTCYTISPAGEFCLGPAPDAVYVVGGEYRQTAQILAANADTPNLPSRFHDIIKWRALMLLAEFDEAPTAMATAGSNYTRMLGDLERDQLPRITIGGGPLA